MTESLQRLTEKMASMPHDVEDAFARQWLAELEDEHIWDEKFSRTSDTIDARAEIALRESQQKHAR